VRGSDERGLLKGFPKARGKRALRYLVWVTSGYRFSIPKTKPHNESSMMGD